MIGCSKLDASYNMWEPPRIYNIDHYLSPQLIVPTSIHQTVVVERPCDFADVPNLEEAHYNM